MKKLEQRNTKMRNAILDVLTKNNHHFLAVHEIGIILKKKSIFYTDTTISAGLRMPSKIGGIRELVYGQRRQGTNRKEWRTIDGHPDI